MVETAGTSKSYRQIEQNFNRGSSRGAQSKCGVWSRYPNVTVKRDLVVGERVHVKETKNMRSYLVTVYRSRWKSGARGACHR